MPVEAPAAESDGSTAFVPFDRTDTRPCSGCGGRDIVTDFGTGDIVCRGCGVVGAARVVLDVPWEGGRGAQSDQLIDLESARQENDALRAALETRTREATCTADDPAAQRPAQAPTLEDPVGFDAFSDDLVMRAFVRAPFVCHGSLHAVNRRFKLLLRSDAFRKLRLDYGLAEHGIRSSAIIDNDWVSGAYALRVYEALCRDRAAGRARGRARRSR